MKKQFLFFVSMFIACMMNAQSLIQGGQFMDLLLPMEGSVAATSNDWGTTSGTNTQYNGSWEGTLGRWKDNGIEDTERSYWGGNIIKDNEGHYHMYIAGWPSATVGHMGWSSKSEVYHVMSTTNVWGPYTYVSKIGGGHNPEIYKTGDTYVIYKIQPLGFYYSKSLGDTWQTGEYSFDLRDRAIIAGTVRETSLSNCSFAKREDGSFVMIDRGGGIWVSRDGLTDAWHHLTDASVYLTGGITSRGSLEDPVIWRDHLQYHMIVNDWNARIAYYYRSLDGLHWTKEAGKAYTGQDPFARHIDGFIEKWHKYERPRIYQDDQGRAVRMNFAVIDCVKQSDLAGDSHSSKNINMPLTKQLLLEVMSLSNTSATVLVKAEEGFNPKTDLDFSSLKFGSHNKVNYGNGFSYASHQDSGNDIVITFTGTSGSINAGEWAPKMLGQKTDGSIAFGYARMPDVDYKPAMLSALLPKANSENKINSVVVENYGQVTSVPTQVKVQTTSGTLLATGEVPATAAYGKQTVTLTPSAKTVPANTDKVVVIFLQNGAEIYRNTLSATEITANRSRLTTLITTAETLLVNDDYPLGRADLQTVLDEAKAKKDFFDAELLSDLCKRLSAANEDLMLANGICTESFDFYYWALKDASISMTPNLTNTCDGHTAAIAKSISDGTETQKINGRLALNQGTNNLNFRNAGEGHNYTGLFNFNKDSYFCICNLSPGDRFTITLAGGAKPTFVSTNVKVKGGAAVEAGTEISSGTTYEVTGDEGSLQQVDILTVHYSLFRSLVIETTNPANEDENANEQVWDFSSKVIWTADKLTSGKAYDPDGNETSDGGLTLNFDDDGATVTTALYFKQNGTATQPTTNYLQINVPVGYQLTVNNNAWSSARGFYYTLNGTAGTSTGTLFYNQKSFVYENTADADKVFTLWANTTDRNGVPQLYVSSVILKDLSPIPTYIIAVEAKDKNTEDMTSLAFSGQTPIYNLQGVRVDKPRKGIYIINGKKIVY